MNEKNYSNVTAGIHPSFWTESVRPLFFEPLQENISTDVVIVGAGISGLSVAYGLLKSGKKVVVIEDGAIGSGETGRTTAHIVNALDDRYYDLESLFGEDGARDAAESHTAAINFVESVIKEESIDCDFYRVNGYLFLHPSDKEENLKKEFDAVVRAGIKAKFLDRIPQVEGIKSKCIEFPQQAQFHPMKYLQGLAKAILAKGGEIYTNSHAKDINSEGVTTDAGFTVTAKHIVVATNAPVNSTLMLPMKQFAFRTYVIAALIKKGSLPRALWWDTGDYEMDKDVPPYHYVRTQDYNSENDLLIIGGEDHATGLADAQEIPEEERYSRLESWAADKFKFEKIVHRWSGQVMEPVDGMGYIGKNPLDKSNVYIVSGDSGNGMTHGSLAGIIIPDLINEKENPWEKLYSPARLKFKSLKAWIKEFGGGFIDYLRHKSKDAKEISLNDIPASEGKIIQLDKEKYGVYRDKQNTLHFVAAECTHMQCIIKWNNDEKSWDCPCHGSRFDTLGKVLNGPANENLFYFNTPDSEKV